MGAQRKESLGPAFSKAGGGLGATPPEERTGCCERLHRLQCKGQPVQIALRSGPRRNTGSLYPPPRPGRGFFPRPAHGPSGVHQPDAPNPHALDRHRLRSGRLHLHPGHRHLRGPDLVLLPAGNPPGKKPGTGSLSAHRLRWVRPGAGLVRKRAVLPDLPGPVLPHPDA